MSADQTRSTASNAHADATEAPPLSEHTGIEPAGECEDELLAKKRASSRERSRRYRERQKAAKQLENKPPGGTVSSSVGKRKGSPCQQNGIENPQDLKMMRYSIPDLPEDIWRHIHSLMPLRDAARASCVSRAFLRCWRCRPNLILTSDTLGSDAHVSGATVSRTLDTLDCILRRHSGVGVKTLQLALPDIANNGNLDSWLQVAVAPGIEELILMPISEMIKYNFPCSLLSEGIRNSIRLLTLGYCAFRPTPELGPFRRLTSLYLTVVGITGYELECLLSHSHALELLDLTNCHEIICLKIPCELQQLSKLIVCECKRLKVIESNAPNLSNLYFFGNIKLSGEILQLKHLSIDFNNVVYYPRSRLPSILPNLETLYLSSFNEDVNTPMLPTKFMYLKQLTISVTSGMTFSPSYDYFSLVSFLDAPPSLQTLVLDVTNQHMGHASVFEDSSSLRQIDERNYCCLKSVKISGFTSAKSLVELTCHILKNAESLESVTLDTIYGWRCYEEIYRTSCRYMVNSVLREVPRALEAIRTYITDKVPATAKFSVLEPCRRCHKVSRRSWRKEPWR